MGYDITVVCEYYDDDNGWTVGQDYVAQYSIDQSAYYQVITPIAQYRNYNLFRPLAGIHNKHVTINAEIDSWLNTIKRKAWDSDILNMIRKHSYDQYYPETTEPTDVIESEVGLPDDCNDVTRDIIERDATSNDVIYSVTLDVLKQFVDCHPTYTQLRLMYNKANTNYIKCDKVYSHKYGKPLAPNKFRIVYGFNY